LTGFQRFFEKNQHFYSKNICVFKKIITFAPDFEKIE